MDDLTYEIPQNVRLLGRAEVGRTEQRLSHGDVPVAFTIHGEPTVRGEPLQVRVAMQYPSSNDEPQNRVAVGDVVVLLGRFSRRVFGLEFSFRQPVDVDKTARLLVQTILHAFEMVSTPEVPLGARLNHQVTRAALFDRVDAPPAWLVDALQRQR
jgi:hypothetical protein